MYAVPIILLLFKTNDKIEYFEREKKNNLLFIAFFLLLRMVGYITR